MTDPDFAPPIAHVAAGVDREDIRRMRYDALFGDPHPAAYVVGPGDELEDVTGADVYRVLDADGDAACLVVVREDLALGDKYHTIPELYEHRRKLTAVLATIAAIDDDSWRSKRHHPDDGPMFDGSFIVGIEMPTGPITYHYPLSSWDEFAAVPELEHAPKWDGAGPGETLTRLADLTAHLKAALDEGRAARQQAREAADAAVQSAEVETVTHWPHGGCCTDIVAAEEEQAG